MGIVEVIGGCRLQWEGDKRGRTVHREGGTTVQRGRGDGDIVVQERWKGDSSK